ncbi:RNA polymerase sigma factor [Kitasatospora arboriphila]
MSALSDAELAEAIAAPTPIGTSRIREVMAEVFTRHHGAVLAYARRYCRDLQTAQDLAAEAYASTYHSVARGRGPRHAWRPYLKACVRRTAMEWSAQTTDRVLLPEDFHSWADHLADETATEGAQLAAEEAELIARAFRALPERWQVLLWFFVVEGESAATVGKRMSMTPSGVRSLAARARSGLREAYLRAHVDEGTGLECRYFTSLLAGAVRRPAAARTGAGAAPRRVPELRPGGRGVPPGQPPHRHLVPDTHRARGRGALLTPADLGGLPGRPGRHGRHRCRPGPHGRHRRPVPMVAVPGRHRGGTPLPVRPAAPPLPCPTRSVRLAHIV